jgi:hypothetical protein
VVAKPGFGPQRRWTRRDFALGGVAGNR